MSFGERAAIEGVLSQLRPGLSIEIGTAEGGSLRRIAAHSRRVISFDLVEPDPEVREIENVELRTGDSHRLLGAELERIVEAGETVEFAMVDGDHTADGARRDMEELLSSEALQRAVVLAHDTLNQEVRRGLEEVPYESYGKVAHVDLDFIGGYVPAEPPLRGQCWGGLGLVIVDGSGDFADAHGGRPAMTPLSDLIWPTAEAMLPAAAGAPAAPGRDAELQRLRELVASMEASASWRLTAPLRSLKSRLRRRGG
jgi:hypothetical protein